MVIIYMTNLMVQTQQKCGIMDRSKVNNGGVRAHREDLLDYQMEIPS